VSWSASAFAVVRTALAAGGIVVAVVLSLKIAVLVLESRLAFYPVRTYFETPVAVGLPSEDVFLLTEDGVRIHAWFIQAGTAGRRDARSPTGGGPGSITRPRVTLLFFHGNAENIGGCLDVAVLTRAAGYDLLLVDYRGYGQSEGQPSEAGLYRDGEAALRYLRERPGIDASRIVVWGRSIGAAVATHLAAAGHAAGDDEPAARPHRPPAGADSPALAGVILESAFTSAPELLRTGGHWILYVASRAGSYRFDSAERMDRVSAPVLVIHGTDDEIAPFVLGRRLYDLAPGRKEFVAIQGGGHNDLMPRHADELWGAVQRFLNGLD